MRLANITRYWQGSRTIVFWSFHALVPLSPHGDEEKIDLLPLLGIVLVAEEAPQERGLAVAVFLRVIG